MPLYIHLAIHFILAVLSGYAVGAYFKKPVTGLLAGVAGGFLIDLDHVLEYFLVFGWEFNIFSFLDGEQFLVSGLIRLWFHAWEYIPILVILAWLFRRQLYAKTIVLALVLGGSVHLLSDVMINNYPFRNYSLIYRYRQDFKAENLLNHDQYQEYLENRSSYEF